jgi:DNA repair exonuclease SbcCD nuclease subunit
MFTLVHAADLHLETTFTDVRGGAARRAALADAFVRIVDLARDRGADALTFGGDLYEAQRAGPQTARLLFEHFARFGKPIYIAPGNHDPYAARSLYARDDLPANVRVFAEPDWSAFPLADDITLYGFGHTPADPPRPFAHARFERPGTRIALVHGSDEQRMPPNKRATAPFTIDEIVAAGATLALAGHFHGGYVERSGATQLAYPGSPEPIKFGERGNHGALLVQIAGTQVTIEPIELARTRLLDLSVDLSGAGSEHAIGLAVENALAGAGAGAHDFVRLRLGGVRERGTRLDRELLLERYGAGIGGLEVIDETTIADYAALGDEPNVRGRAIADLLGQRASGNPHAEAALRAIVAAFDGTEIAP